MTPVVCNGEFFEISFHVVTFSAANVYPKFYLEFVQVSRPFIILTHRKGRPP